VDCQRESLMTRKKKNALDKNDFWHEGILI
jgi:hypothetical protein